MPDPEAKVALLAGASGLVGGHVLGALLAAPEFTRIYAITRRPLGREHARLANRIVQFERLEEQLKGTSCHTAFCCLGTTLKAGDEDELHAVELDYVVSFARAARAAGAQRFVMLSCAGADAGSRNPHYRVKAQAEQAVVALGFPALDILQPGALLGMRREFRPGDIARGLTLPLMNVLLTGSREPRRAIPAREVAAAMLGVTRSGRRGTNRYTYAAIRAQALVKPIKALQPPPSKSSQRRRG